MNYAVILAAGKGTRMKTELPKCAFPLLKKPMVEYLVDEIKKTSIDKIICVVGHKKEVLMDILQDKVEYAFQEEQLGIGHVVLCAKKIIGDNQGYTIIMPGDTPLIDEEIIDSLIDAHLLNKNDVTIATIKLDNPTSFGRIKRNKENNITKIVEEKDCSSEEKKIKEVNTGLYLIDNKLLFEVLDRIDNKNASKEYYLTDIIEILSKTNKIGSFTIEDTYKLNGINDLYVLSKVENALRKDINKRHMLNGVNLINEDTITIAKDVTIESGTTIYPGCLITGKTTISKNCIIGPNSELHNATIEQNAIIKQSVIYDSKVSQGASVGPFTHLRMNAVVGENDRIGNFVEIKKSTLGTKTNVAHLTYIGDTTCGSHVNFGCGTVTVNYDGVNKHQTIIGDNVFIGCNTNLIAPVTIGDNAFIAAGSTIYESLNPNSFSIARARQVTKENYPLKYKVKK